MMGDAPDPRECARSRVPWGLFGMLALVLAVELFVARRGLRFMTSVELDWRSVAHAASRKAPGLEVVVFGDSMLKFGIAPRVLEASLGCKAYNFSLQDGKPSLTYHLFRRAIEAGTRPKALIVNFSPEGLKQPSWHLLTNPHWVAFPASLREAWELARAHHDAEFFGRLLSARVLPSVRSRRQIRSTILAALKGQDVPDVENNASLRRNFEVNRGGILLPKQPGFRGEVPPDCALDLLNDCFEIDPVNALYVRRLVRLAADHDVAVYWLIPPYAAKVVAHRDGNGVHAKYDAFARGLLAEFPNLRLVDARHSAYPSEVFVDPVHLDRDGAKALTMAVADVLRREWIGLAPIARRVELPPYRDRRASLALEDVDQSREALRLDDTSRRR